MVRTRLYRCDGALRRNPNLSNSLYGLLFLNCWAISAATTLATAAATSIATPVDFDSSPITVRRASPQVGEHTADITAEYGLESTT